MVGYALAKYQLASTVAAAELRRKMVVVQVKDRLE
jgi:hypothetical protein